MDRVEKRAFFGALLIFIFALLTGWKFRSRNFYYAMDICEVLLLTAILKVSPLLKLSVNDLIAMASVMLLNKVILPFLYIPSDSHPRTIPFVFLLSLELYVLVRLIHKRKHGYAVVITYAAASCWIALSLYRKRGQILYSLPESDSQKLPQSAGGRKDAFLPVAGGGRHEMYARRDGNGTGRRNCRGNDGCR